MPSLFEAHITNLGTYNEGRPVGETLKFPTTAEEVQSLLKRIGVDGIRYEEFFITSFDGDVLGLHDHLSEYENLDELNHLACLLSELDQEELAKFEEEDLGRHFTEDLAIPAELKGYFDYEAYGRDVSINEGGHFAPGGYVVQTSGNFTEHYHGPQDIPREHKVFALSQLSIREQMAAYQEVVARAADHKEKHLPDAPFMEGGI